MRKANTMDELYHRIVKIIEEELQQPAKSYSSGKFTGVGWLFPANVKDGEGSPLISVKQYEKTVNLYLFLFENDQSIISQYESVFKKSNIGKSCIRLKALTPEKEAALRELVQKAEERI